MTAAAESGISERIIWKNGFKQQQIYLKQSNVCR